MLCTVGSLVSEQKQNFSPFTVNFDDFVFVLFDNSSANHTSGREHSGYALDRRTWEIK